MTAPCPNSFVVQCLDENDKTELYWICYCLWQSGQFERLLVGSVIPFLRIHEATTVIMKGIVHSGQNREARIESINAFEKLQSVENNLKQTLKLIARQRQVLATQYLKP